jgi:hypothetical protein
MVKSLNGFDSVIDELSSHSSQLALKANQTDLNTTNANVSANTAQLALKANQTDLNTTNANVSANASSLAETTQQMNSRNINAMFPPSSSGLTGIKADGVTDDTTALQAFVNYIVANQLYGLLPKGNIKITSPIHFPSGSGWGLEGVGFYGTQIIQYTNNVAVFTLGDAKQGTGGIWCNNIIMKNIMLTYSTQQPNTNTSAYNFLLNDMYYECSFTKLTFQNGYYGFKVTSGIGGPWGCTFDDLQFNGGLTGGAMDWTGATNGVPNNHFGRMVADAGNMTGTIFNNIKGYDCVIDTIEVFDCAKGAQIMSTQAGSIINIGALKVESGKYVGPQTLFNFLTGSKIKIGQFTIISTCTFDSTNGDITLFNTTGGGSTGWVEIDMLVISSNSITGQVYLFLANNTTGGWIRCKYLNMDTSNWQLSKVGSNSSNDVITIDNWLNNRLSADKGDVDYTINLGDPNTICFNTALTAPRTVNLPSANYNLFNGLKYKIISYGAVNGTNTITIKCNGNVMATLTADKTAVEFTYRHDPSYAYKGFKTTGYQTLP